MEREEQGREVMFGKLWEFLNGKKTYIGIAITVLTALAAFLGVVLPVFGVDAVVVAQILGYITLAIGLLHKVAKWLGVSV